MCALSRLNRLTYRQDILHGGLPGPYLGEVRWARSQVKGQGHEVKKRDFQACDFYVQLVQLMVWGAVMTSLKCPLSCHVNSGRNIINPICLLCMCVCQSIMAKGLLDKRAVHEEDAGGT